MKLLVWNIRQGGGTRRPRILERIKLHNPDVIALLEYVSSNSEGFERWLANSGWAFRLVTNPTGRNHQIAVFSRSAISAQTSKVKALDESGLWLEVFLDRLAMNVGLVHVPTSTRGATRAYSDGLLEVAEAKVRQPFLMAGDFNTGMDPIDGDLRTLGFTGHFEALQAVGLVDAWRHFHGERAETTYTVQGKNYRLDHALASPDALSQVLSCSYSHLEREESISDHSALLIEIREHPKS